MKLKELLVGLSSMALSEAEVVSVMALLCDKNPHALDTWHKVSRSGDPGCDDDDSNNNLLSGLQALVFPDAPGNECAPRSLMFNLLQSAAKADPEAQERERLFLTLREEASIAKDKVKQLSQVSHNHHL